MGIHGLSSFIQEHSSLGKHKSWNENDSEDSCFIVDGNAYVYHYALQCKTDWTYGGNMENLDQTLEGSIGWQARITPVFLFDGALPQDKEATRIKRYRNYIEKVVSTFNSLKQINDSNKTGEENPEDAIQYWGDLYLIPPLTLEVVVQTLRELDVEVIMCRGEADGMVAELAEERDGYVVSKDSDMHVYPHLGKGYLPLDLFSIGKDPIVSGTLYQPQVLASFLRIDTSMLPLFGTLLGNDYFDIQMVRYPIMEWCSAHGFGLKSQSSAQWPKYVAEFLRTIVPKNGIDKEVIGAVVKELKPIILASSMNQRQEKADGLEQAIICSIERYDSTSPLITTDVEAKQAIELSSLLQAGQLSRQILDIVETQTFWSFIFLEDLSKESSCVASQSLRQYLYTLVHPNATPTVTEYLREKQHLATVEVPGLSLEAIGNIIHKPVKADDLLKNYKLRSELFLSLHNTTPAILAKANTTLHSLILCLRYLITSSHENINRQLANHEVIGLLVAGMKSLGPHIGFAPSDMPSPDRSKPSLNKRAIHLAAQYQAVLYSSYLLGQLVYGPGQYLQVTGVLASSYDGLEIHTSLQHARVGAHLSRILAGSSTEFKTMFCHLWAIVTDKLEHAISPVFDYGLPSLSQGPVPAKYWTRQTNLKKRAKSSGEPKNDRSAKRTTAKSSPGQAREPNKNVFNVLSFGCSFDDE